MWKVKFTLFDEQFGLFDVPQIFSWWHYCNICGDIFCCLNAYLRVATMFFYGSYFKEKKADCHRPF